MKKDVVILMPCLNEGENLRKSIKMAKKYIKKSKLNISILVVDNQSIDNSIDICIDENVQYIIESNKGYGSALISGINYIDSKYIIMGDSDGTYNFKDLDLFINKLNKGYDLVIGNRYLGKMDKKAMPLLNKYFGTPIISFIGRLLFKVEVGDFNCGLRAINKDSFKKINFNNNGMPFAVEMIAKAAINNLRIAEVPTDLFISPYPRKVHLKRFKDGYNSIKTLLDIKLKSKK
ncbi:MAG: glycosyltransferase family 2 protein [Bacilli bacterium]|nr:glycosyltransferase family 2 protein [Bacilli bacterium]